MGISPEDFKASWGWYDKFSKRYGLQSVFVGKKEEMGTVATGNGNKIQSLQELHRIMGAYDPEWVFSVEESSLFYDALPFAVLGEGERRNRVTLVLSCNSTGRLTLPICMVGREKWPMEVFSNFPVKYLTQDRAWLDRPTFGSWYSTVFVPFVRDRTSKQVILLVDGERPGHQGDFEDDGIRLVFLPPPVKSTKVAFGSANAKALNVDVKTWWSRPLQMGVVAALKAEYKYLLVQSALSYHNYPQEVKEALKAGEQRGGGNIGGVHFGHAPTLLDAARLLAQAWSQVPADLLENCFARANMVPPSKLLGAPSPPGASQEQLELVRSHRDNIASKIEGMLISSSFRAHAWTTMGGQNPSVNVRDQVRAFLLLDEDNSAELQQQLQREISEALGDSVSLVPTSNPVVPPASVTETIMSTPEIKPDLALRVRGLLLGITDVASQLRLLPRTGADAEKLAPHQLEGCIAAADQIRHCVQAFDRTLRSESTSSEQLQVQKSPPNEIWGDGSVV
ncbi:hypothetical protein PF005_g27285 [Phytophthora fragariae]|uniref:HTH CENPB-type domain-containing protein n=1 Tax=Phytophthora fragariae TaxID=53985 RepID=A0A6A3DTR3_9STRA|nr:hypothetical protein PF009_g27945 [Phytophthora fragariae]KAE9068585.1 hypothetical protein PF010_g27006 [Phytophthora fragariae]KAE9069559.1 hypothetical protein PF007_g27271 [Phytophthora fragariae]KAE9082666.1 hypothetical protein PF006_g26857 [Phytophthora fragariae]KAE9171101.1 hypothetical protein PF005_g27285 [Phytophthora fragariae]